MGANDTSNYTIGWLSPGVVSGMLMTGPSPQEKSGVTRRLQKFRLQLQRSSFIKISS